MTGQTQEVVDLAQLVDLDASVICSARKCKRRGEQAVAMLIVHETHRTPIGLDCVVRVTAKYRRWEQQNSVVTNCVPCGTVFSPPWRVDNGYWQIVPL